MTGGEEEREAFAKAVTEFAEWKWGGPEPQVPLKNRPWPISSIFSVAEAFDGTVPENIHTLICDLAKNFRGQPEAIGHDCAGPKDNTYNSDALCLQRLYVARVAYYKRKEIERS